MDKLFIYLTDEEQVECIQTGDQVQTASRQIRASLMDIASYLPGRQVIVLVPAERIILARVAVPTTNRQRQLQAVPYLLEDLLANDVEQLHFALGSYQDGEVTVAAVAHQQMRDWMERLAEAGIQTKFMVPDLLALPYSDETWSVALIGDVARVRHGPQSGFCCDTENLAMALERALEDAGENQPQSLKVTDCRDNMEIALEKLLPEGIKYLVTACDNGLLSQLAMGYQEGDSSSINLLQGGYSQRERLSKLWRPWRPAAALLVALLAVQGVMASVEYQRLNSKKEQLEKQIEESFHQGFPGIKRIVNPRLQAERSLKSLRARGSGGAGFLSLMVDVGPVLQSVPDALLQGISYKEGGLVLDMRLKNLQQLDELEQKLKQKSTLAVEVLSASSRSKDVEARIKIGVGQ